MINLQKFLTTSLDADQQLPSPHYSVTPHTLNVQN